MVKRRLLLVLAVGLLAGLGVAGWMLLRPQPLPPEPPPPGVTPDNFRRLRQGMSIAEVEAALGEPEKRIEMWALTTQVWKGEGCRISITFGMDALFGELDTEDGQVVGLPPSHPPPSVWERLSRWLPW
jgi:hypothetical protein